MTRRHFPPDRWLPMVRHRELRGLGCAGGKKGLDAEDRLGISKARREDRCLGGPIFVSVERTGRIVSEPVLDRLHHRYRRRYGRGEGFRKGHCGLAFRRRVHALGARDRPIRPHSPWMNGHVERLIGSTRRECLDHVIVINAAHLRRLLKAYAAYYNDHRTHLGLAKDAPGFRPVETTGKIVSEPVLGGLHHRYRRV